MLFVALPLALAAALPPPYSASSEWLVVSLGAVAVAVDRVLSIVIKFKKPRASIRRRTGATSARTIAGALGSGSTTLETEMRLLNTTVANEPRTANRSLGRLEGAAGTVQKETFPPLERRAADSFRFPPLALSDSRRS